MPQDPAGTACHVDGSGSTTYAFDADGNRRSVETPAGDLTTSTWNVSRQDTAVEVATDEYTFRAFGETAAETGSTDDPWQCGRLG